MLFRKAYYPWASRAPTSFLSVVLCEADKQLKIDLPSQKWSQNPDLSALY